MTEEEYWRTVDEYEIKEYDPNDPHIMNYDDFIKEQLEILKRVFRPMSSIIKWLYFRNIDIYD